MTRGYPDFGRSVGRSQEGEFLQNLAQPPVWFQDNFDTPSLNWTVQGGAAVIRVGASYSGHGYVRQYPATGSAGSMYKYVGIPPVGNYTGYEIFFQTGAADGYVDASQAIIVISAIAYDGTDYYSIKVRYNPNDGKWWIYDGTSGVYVHVLTHEIATSVWHRAKLIFDLNALKYIRLYVDDQEVDLTDYTFYSSTSSNLPQFLIMFQTNAATAKAPVTLIDSLKITYGEN